MPRWTAEARKKQAARCKRVQPWRKSTGPKTSTGKIRSAMNAYKHGHYTAPARELRRLLRVQTHLVKEMKLRASLNVISNGATHRRNLPRLHEISRHTPRNDTTRARMAAPYCRTAQIGVDSYPRFSSPSLFFRRIFP